jgi:hypothetical protein
MNQVAYGITGRVPFSIGPADQTKTNGPVAIFRLVIMHCTATHFLKAYTPAVPK